MPICAGSDVNECIIIPAFSLWQTSRHTIKCPEAAQQRPEPSLVRPPSDLALSHEEKLAISESAGWMLKQLWQFARDGYAF